MTQPLGHFVKLDEFSKKALELPKVHGWLKTRQFKKMLEGKEQFENRSVTAHYFNELDPEKDDGLYKPYITHAFSEVRDEIDRHFIDNAVDKAQYVDTFRKKASMVISQLEVNTGLRLLEEKNKNIDMSLNHGRFFRHNNLAIKEFIVMLRAWMGQLEMLQEYLDEKYKTYTETKFTPDSTECPTLAQNQDIKAPADKQHIRERTKTYEFPYLAPLGILYKYHERFNGEHWETIDIQSFIACFDCKLAPKQNLILRNIFLFCYFLSKLTPEIGAVKINDINALEFFGITGYHNTVTKAKDAPNRKIKDRRAIDVIFNSTKFTLK